MMNTQRKAKTRKIADQPVTRALIPRDGLATVSEACDFLRVERTTIWKFVKTGVLKATKLNGSMVRIHCDSLWQLAKSGS